MRIAAFLLLLPGPLSAQDIQSILDRQGPEAARIALERQIASHATANLHRAHLEGLIALRTGRPTDAARIFRAVLDIAPGFEPARLSLIVALRQLGQNGPALRQISQLADSTVDQRLRDRLLQNIARRPEPGPDHGVSLRFAVIPSTNITGGTDAGEIQLGGLRFTINPESRRASGVGLTLGATAWKGWAIGQDWRATAAASLDKRLFRTDLRPDEAELALRLDIRRDWRHAGLSFGPRYELLAHDGTVVRNRAGLGLSASYLLDPRARLGLSAEWWRQRHPGARYRDGHLLRGVAGIDWQAHRNTVVSLDFPFERETARADHLSHRDLGLSLGVQHKFDSGLTLGATLSHRHERYDSAYPGFGIARRDRVTSLTASFSHEVVNWRGLMPEFSVTRKRRNSNIPLHESWTTDFGLSFARRF